MLDSLFLDSLPGSSYPAKNPELYLFTICTEEGVTHIVNGCSRLQPVAVAIGQAAGEAAAQAVRGGVGVHDLDVADVQRALIAAGCVCVPDREVGCDDPRFAERQRAQLGL